MKKIITILMISLMLIPNIVNAKEEYKSLTFKETLKEEEIAEQFKNYEENDDQITIYLFRGQGCSYCRAFLEFMNSITEEYGKYFKIKTYEVWNDSKNASLMEEVSNYLNEPADGVPYIIIGSEVFSGYAEEYDDGIKKAIKEVYDTEKSERYDVFKEMKEHPKKDVKTTEENKKSDLKIGTDIITIISVAIGTIVIIIFNNLKFEELKREINEKKKITKRKTKEK